MNAHTVDGNHPFERMRSAMAGAFQSNGRSAPDAIFHAGAQIYGMMLSQARTLAYVDVIWILVVLTGLLIPLPFLMQRPKKGGPTVMAH